MTEPIDSPESPIPDLPPETPPSFQPREEVFVPARSIQAPRKNRGCLYAALASALLIVMIVGAIVLMARAAIVAVRDNFTSDVPMALPTVSVDEEAAQDVAARYDAFVKALEDRQPAEPLRLDEQDVNVLIARHPQWSILKDKVYVSLEGDEVTATMSVRIGELDLPVFRMFANRYLNGEGTFSVFQRDGLLYVYVLSLTVKDKSLPEEALAGFRAQNLAEGLNRDPNMRDVRERLDRVEIEDGAIVLTPKVLPSESEEEAPASPDADQERNSES